jgi:hypothetical protein
MPSSGNANEDHQIHDDDFDALFTDAMGDIDAMEIFQGPGPAGIGPAGIGPASIGPAGIGPAGIGPAGIGPAGIGPAGIVTHLDDDIVSNPDALFVSDTAEPGPGSFVEPLDDGYGSNDSNIDVFAAGIGSQHPVVDSDAEPNLADDGYGSGYDSNIDEYLDSPDTGFQRTADIDGEPDPEPDFSAPLDGSAGIIPPGDIPIASDAGPNNVSVSAHFGSQHYPMVDVGYEVESDPGSRNIVAQLGMNTQALHALPMPDYFTEVEALFTEEDALFTEEEAPDHFDAQMVTNGEEIDHIGNLEDLFENFPGPAVPGPAVPGPAVEASPRNPLEPSDMAVMNSYVDHACKTGFCPLYPQSHENVSSAALHKLLEPLAQGTPLTKDLILNLLLALLPALLILDTDPEAWGMHLDEWTQRDELDAKEQGEEEYLAALETSPTFMLMLADKLNQSLMVIGDDNLPMVHKSMFEDRRFPISRLDVRLLHFERDRDSL